MRQASQILLREPGTGRSVPALLLDALDPISISRAVTPWKQFSRERIREWIAAGVPRNQWPQHSHWDWERKATHYDGLLAYQFLGVTCEDAMQGLALAVTEGKSCLLPEQAGKPLVYVHYIATAPWNDPDFTDRPRFRAVGSVLLAAALQLSIANGFKGRLGLHALPQAETFYRERVGMSDLGVDAAVENLRYFEMTPQQANAYLEPS